MRYSACNKAGSTTSTCSSSTKRVSITRSVTSAPSATVSPALQFGTAVCRTGGSAGVPSSCSSL
jgi:hypothetical protein